MMKNILISFLLVASLVFGSTLAFGSSPVNQSDAKHMKTSAQELKKGLHEAFVIENGKDSWVLHQPKHNPPQYFLPHSGGKMAGSQNGEGQVKPQKG